MNFVVRATKPYRSISGRFFLPVGVGSGEIF
jgi:hypothetical protein